MKTINFVVSVWTWLIKMSNWSSTQHYTPSSVMGSTGQFHCGSVDHTIPMLRSLQKCTSLSTQVIEAVAVIKDYQCKVDSTVWKTTSLRAAAERSLSPRWIIAQEWAAVALVHKNLTFPTRTWWEWRRRCGTFKARVLRCGLELQLFYNPSHLSVFMAPCLLRDVLSQQHFLSGSMISFSSRCTPRTLGRR